VDYFSITDTYDPLSNRRAFYDASHVLPPAMLECYVAKYPAPTLETFRYALRSGMMGWCTIMQDTTAWTREQHDAASEEFAQYKRHLRPLIRSANLYHISPRPDGVHWDGIQYFDPRAGQGAVYAFRGKIRDEPQHRFRLRGLKPGELYQARFVRDSQPEVEAAGAELMRRGLAVSLPVPESSAIALLTEVHRR
jgi:alpha-galactosidase